MTEQRQQEPVAATAEPSAPSEFAGDDLARDPGVTTRLTGDEIDGIARRYRDRKPTYPCPTCKGTEWALAAIGGGRETWACKAASDARPVDWDHYGASSVLALVAEIRLRRAADLSAEDIARVRATRDEMARFDFLDQIPELIRTLDRILRAHGATP